MQYKIPIHIENEDEIVAHLSLRQLMIIMAWGGIGYVIYTSSKGNVGDGLALGLAAPFVIIGIIIALLRVSEMTFLPIFLNYLRLTLNSKSRIWSHGTDSYTDMQIGYIVPNNAQKEITSNKRYEDISSQEFENKLGNL